MIRVFAYDRGAVTQIVGDMRYSFLARITRIFHLRVKAAFKITVRLVIHIILQDLI